MEPTREQNRGRSGGDRRLAALMFTDIVGYSHLTGRDETLSMELLEERMVIPLMQGARILGVITLADREDGRPFLRDHFLLMHLIAKDLAFVIENSQLREKLIRFAA